MMVDDIVERLRTALNNAMRPGTADSDVNVFTLPVEVARGNLEMAITEIVRLRTTVANIQQIAGKASIDGQTMSTIKRENPILGKWNGGLPNGS